MSKTLKQVKIAPKGMGLNDWVAKQEGFFDRGARRRVRLENFQRNAVD